MRRAYLSVVLAVVLPAISVFAQGRGGGEPGGGGGHGGGGFHGSFGGHAGGAGFGGHGGFGHVGGGFHGSFGGRGGFGHVGGFHGGHGGGFHGGHGFYHGRGFDHGFHHGHGFGGVVILGGYGFPYCYPYYGCSGYPYYTASYSDYGDYGAAAVDTYDEPADPPSPGGAQVSTYTAQDAQGYYAVGDQLVHGQKSYIVDATPAQQDAFRSGFIASAMPNAAETYDQAMQQAAPAPQS